MFFDDSGKHLGVVRNWIKWNARNGEKVVWGSNEILQLKTLSVADFEQLAQSIHNGALEEFKKFLKNEICKNFEPNLIEDNARLWNFCKHCENHKDLHKRK